MAAADVVVPFDANLAEEVVVLTVSDGETYTAKRLSVIKGALASGNSDVDADLNVTFSGAVATVNWAGQTDKTLTLRLFGYL